MKKQLKALLLVAFFACTTLPAWSQASTQGKEFWVSSSIVCSPAKDKGIEPYIAISSEHACTVTITGGVGNAINITRNVTAGSWTEFKNSDGLTWDKWYPINTKEPATVCNLAGQKNMYGLHITATANISVYVILRGESSMDASNILPLNALGTEYYVQDFKAEAHNDKSWPTNAGNMVTVTTILGTENGTMVDITPAENTFDNHAKGITYTITLDKGQTYYLISQKENQLAGTHIVARNDKKIAIYTGSPLTRLPNGVSARDALFEQPMPVEYWGTQFIVTRSLGKNGNIIGITASQDGTEIKLDGYSQNPGIYINEGETYYIALQNAGNPQANKPGTSRVDKTIIGDVLFIETSCPCEVYSYDTGNGYVGKEKDAGGAVINELVDGQKGDPSSVWVSPIQQKINKITFGACYTNLTKAHFLNIVTETATCANTVLTAYMGQYGADWSDKLIWTPVPGNPTYSYARVQIGNNTETINVFTLENRKGFIAHIYGNGDDESYAYSAGSAAVEQGVNVNGETFTDGYRSENKFCFGDSVVFDAKVGTDAITRVDWYFGDGTSEYYGQAQTQHTYTSPGWYDVTADLYGHQVCTNEDEVSLGQVTFSFLVYRPDTLMGTVQPTECVKLEDYKARKEYWDEKILHGDMDTVQENCYDDVVLNFVTYAAEKEEFLDTLKGQDLVQGYNGLWYDASTDVVDTLKDPYSGCNIYRHYYVKVITCLDLEVHNTPSTQRVCPGETFNVTYTKHKGNIDGDAIFRVAGYPDQTILMDDKVTDGSFTLPISDIKKPGYYSGKLLVNDLYCPDRNPKEYTIDFTVYYPDSIFKFKFNNVLAMYKPGHGGNSGYEFSNYEWHLIRGVQDTVMAAGPEVSILYLGQGVTFQSGDIVYVVLTDKDGMTLPSCPQVITNVKDFNPQPQNAPATKQLIDRRIVIKKGEQSYNIYGQRIR